MGALELTHDFANGYPTDATVEKLYDERDFQRACQAYLWSLPAVSFKAWQRGITKELGAYYRVLGLLPGPYSRDSPLLLRNIGTQDVYSLDWKAAK
jgi:hypothetical protein